MGLRSVFRSRFWINKFPTEEEQQGISKYLSVCLLGEVSVDFYRTKAQRRTWFFEWVGVGELRCCSVVFICGKQTDKWQVMSGCRVTPLSNGTATWNLIGSYQDRLAGWHSIGHYLYLMRKCSNWKECFAANRNLSFFKSKCKLEFNSIKRQKRVKTLQNT